MKRAWQAAAIYLVFLGVALAAMGWVSFRLLEFERADAEAQKNAVVEENVRLALWRMETALAPFIVAESARPPYEYQSFHSSRRAMTGEYTALPEKLVLTASPLLVEPLSPYVRLYFQIDAAGQFSSPETPQGFQLGASLNNYYNGQMIEESTKRLTELKTVLGGENLAARLPPLGAETNFNAAPLAPVGVQTVFVPDDASGQKAEQRPQAAQQAEARQSQLNRDEMQARMKNFIEANNGAVMQQQQAASQAPNAPKGGPASEDQSWSNGPNQAAAAAPENPPPQYSGMLQPLWLGDQLFLARRAQLDGADYVQGIWLDWNRIRGWLLSEIRDLLPNAALQPAASTGALEHSRRLAALPVLLEAGALPGQPEAPRGLLLRPLIAAWICLLLAAAAVGALIFGLIALGERRRAFVTAVSHELRTPLTTFSMYTDMLAGPLGEDAEKRGKYLRTLRAESRRLGHMVENILSYARLENTNRRGRIEEIDLAALVQRNADGLRERAERQEMTLTLRVEESGPFALANQTAVEQILFNLVDNACKYGRFEADDESGEANRSEIIVETFGVADGAAPGLRVSDRGPGIDPADLASLFKPFHKSAQKAAKTAPGVGLGLALSLRLAREMGGDLKLVKGQTEGACFELILKETS